MTSYINTKGKGSRTKRGPPRPCAACGRAFRRRNNKAKYCGPACKQARHRQKSQEPQIVTAGTTVARVTMRSKSLNENKSVLSCFPKPRVTAKSGWHIEAGELVFYPMPDAARFTPDECRRYAGGHMRLADVGAHVDAHGDGDIADLGIAPGISAGMAVAA